MRTESRQQYQVARLAALKGRARPLVNTTHPVVPRLRAE
ncbi:hypothetical protein E2C01_082567 [Portunus trituberculatus]|uniref:Uncharacterized protein n=1 Tax=Portunus trituberculatus TaxID=210409 RepID=A0A5B7IYT1_PORTR|nr:hypothetical protein [Portunus trituberculatus]